MSEITHSTLTSPRSPLFSDSDSPGHQSGSEIVTSDEEPDLGAFTTVLRAWGHLQPPLRIPPHFQSSSSSRTRSTPTTITGYPGFGGGDSDTVEESTVWNRIPIQSYLHSSSRATRTTSTNRTERAAGVLEEADESYFSSSPPPSPASESARTVEIASETDAASLHEFVSYEDGASGERLVVPVATPSSIDAQTVSVASAVESHDEQTQPSPSVPPSLPTSYDLVVNDISTPPMSSVPSISSPTSNQPLDDNTTISRSRPYGSTLSIISYQPQISTTHAQSSVFQESPSPALISDAPFRESQTTTSSSPTIPIALSRSTMGRTVSSFSHAESDIINAYYAQRPSELSSADQPALESPWTRRLELLAPPPPNSQRPELQPLVEQDSPSEHRQTPSVVDDNSSASAIPDDTPPPSATTSAALSVLHEFVIVNSESSDIPSSHSLTPSHTVAFPTTSATATATRQHSLESSTVLPHPSLPTTHREQTHARGQTDPAAPYQMQQASPQPRYHFLSQDSDYDQPSLGYLDEALSFIVAERARWTAAREAGLQRGSSPQRGEEIREGLEEGVAGEDASRRYTTEPRTKRRKRQPKTSTITPATPPSTINDTFDSGPNDTTSSKQTSSLNRLTNGSNIVTLNSPSPRKKKDKSRSKQILISRDIKPISILKRPDPNGASSSLLSNARTHTFVGGSPSKSEHDDLATPRALRYLYPWSSDHQDTIEDEEVDDEDEDDSEDGKRNLRSDTSRSYIHRRDSKRERTSTTVYRSIPNTPHHVMSMATRSKFDPGLENEEEGENENPRTYHGHSLIGSRTFEREENGVTGVDKQDKGKEKEKEKGKKKKSRTKRKLPVTAPILTSPTLSHSRSVPDLWHDAYVSANTDSAVEESHSSGVDMPGLAIGLPHSENKGKKKGKGVVRPSPAGHVASLVPLGEVGCMQDKRVRLITLAYHLQALFPEERAQLRKICRKLDGRSPAMDGAAPSSSKKKKAKAFLDDCSFDYSSLGDSDLQRGRHEEEDPDPRGEGPGKNDTPVHIFIDHSNILIGFLSYLKRISRNTKLPPKSKSAITQPTDGAGASTNTGPRPLPIPKTKAGLPIPEARPLIPLPSFATAHRDISSLSCSAPSRSFTNDLMAPRRKDASSDGDGHDYSGYDDDPPTSEFERHGQIKSENEPARPVKDKIVKTKRASLHLWHTALILILERGRPVSRRVVVASSPLYQPMEHIERLGYEVKIFMRVPDFGSGADRLEKSTKYDQNKDTGSPKKRASSPVRAIGYGSLGSASGSRNRLEPPSKKVHVRQISDNMSSDTGAAASTSGHQTARVKYREQGVDELLQLKLHQVIAATDDVPEGATIVLATGDGNVGQFNEDGFLGPVRTALKRGWKVELYAWEDGLSRAWRREFGPSSEWGRNGMFRIIGMEQFSDYLVEIGER